MNSRTVTLGVVCLVLFAGCVGSPGGRDLTGSVDVYIGNHAQPLEEFSQLNVTITQVTFVPADRASGDENTPANGTPPERFEMTVDRTTVDLTTVQGDSAALVNRLTLPVRERYRTVVVTVSVESATLTSGAQANVTVPNGTLTLNTDFAVEPRSNTSLLLDMSTSGTNGTYTLRATGRAVKRNLTAPTAGSGPTEPMTATPTDTDNESAENEGITTVTPTPTETATPNAA